MIDQVGNREQIFFGAYIRLEKLDPQTDAPSVTEYRIVGPDETDAKKGYISIDSPLAKALLKKKVGDHASIKVAEDIFEYLVIEISYSP